LQKGVYLTTVTGGFPGFPDRAENTEVEAKALSALSYQVIEYFEFRQY